MIFGTKKYYLCVNSSAKRFWRFSIHGSTVLGVSFELLAEIKERKDSHPIGM
jgi:hypothetical protein